MKTLELAKGFVTIVEGVEEIDKYTKNYSHYHIEKDFKNKDCVMLCEFKINNTDNIAQPIFFYDKGNDNLCVEPLYGHNHYTAYLKNNIFIDLIDEFLKLHPDAQKYVGWKGIFNILISHNREYYTKDGEKIIFKMPIFRVDHPAVCICMSSIDENNEKLELQITEANDKFILGTTYHGFGSHIKLYTSYDAAVEDKICSLKKKKNELLEMISDINEQIEKTMAMV